MIYAINLLKILVLYSIYIVPFADGECAFIKQIIIFNDKIKIY